MDQTSNEVTIQGIKGTLAYDSSRNIHTFTRDKSGKAVTLTAPAQIEATLPEFSENDIVIIFSGNYDKTKQPRCLSYNHLSKSYFKPN